MKKELQQFINELKQVSNKALDKSQGKHEKGTEEYYNKQVGAEIEYIYKRLEMILKEAK